MISITQELLEAEGLGTYLHGQRLPGMAPGLRDRVLGALALALREPNPIIYIAILLMEQATAISPHSGCRSAADHSLKI